MNGLAGNPAFGLIFIQLLTKQNIRSIIGIVPREVDDV
jgi:hypothetical protein